MEKEETKGGFVKVVSGAVVTGAVVVGSAVLNSAHAAMDFTNVVVSTADVFTFAGIVLVASAAIWPIRKLVKLSNKS